MTTVAGDRVGSPDRSRAGPGRESLSRPRPDSAPTFLQAVEDGLVGDAYIERRCGRNTAVPNGSFAFVTLLGQTAMALTTTGKTVRIKAGGHANDDSEGSACRSVFVRGLSDSTLEEVIEEIATAGASASSTTSTSFRRIYDAWCADNGSFHGTNAGDITIEEGAGTFDVLKIVAGAGQAHDALWTVPSGLKASLLSVAIAVDSVNDADVRIRWAPSANKTSVPYPSVRTLCQFNGVVGPMLFEPQEPIASFDELTDIWAEARGAGAATAVSVDLRFLVQLAT